MRQGKRAGRGLLAPAALLSLFLVGIGLILGTIVVASAGTQSSTQTLPFSDPNPAPMPSPVPAAVPSTVLGLPVIPGHTYVGSTSEGYPVVLWASADGKRLEPQKEAGELTTFSFLIQASRPDDCPVVAVTEFGRGRKPDEIALLQQAFEEGAAGLYGSTVLVWATLEEIPILKDTFQKEINDVRLSGTVKKGLAKGEFGGSVKFSHVSPGYGEGMCNIQPVSWTASLQ